MKYNALYISVLLLLAVWGLYFGNFHGSLSEVQGDWGTFGDFTGGVINPLLNFITIYLLITQYRTSREDMTREREEGDIKSFESSFFTFTTIALNEYRDFEIEISGISYKAAEAVSMIQKYVEASTVPKQALADLDGESHDVIYSLVASFCVVFRLIQDSCPAKAKEKYTQTLSMLLPIKVTYLLCICDSFTKWGMLDHPKALGYFNKESVKLVHDHYAAVASK
ncbi:hypothetical protein IRZ53_15305 [Pseudomonas fulva]|uniref:hypothetical protein n=1 Tax=Pseudomonas fulva TaxID=47880 RepID=UPI0018ABF8F6|nr:hypothetical protein [Pseudomonas fulva]MBF8675921.1 hypothetical protein [Pseudomonas fulva]MBF8698155.1 hypothetical protein [Pseudomonas fulva]